MLIFVRSVILLLIIFWAGFCGNVGLANAGPQVFILHDPIQPKDNQAVTYTATANDPQGIKSIVISVQRRLLGDHKNQKISDLQSEAVIKTCPEVQSSSFPSSLKCEVKDGPYLDVNHIGYKATATNGVGETSTDGYVYFAAGTFPWSDDPVPIYVHEADTAEKIDLVFIPDTDYITVQNWEQVFMQNVTDLIWEAFFSDKPFAQKVRNRREMWNFYITYRQGDAKLYCNRTVPPNWTTLAATANSGFIVHNEVFQDCSGIGEGSTFSSEPIDPNDQRSYTVPIHELGHSVFSLADEYPGGYLFYLPLYSHNVFPGPKSTKCKSNAQSFGWPPRNCKQIGHTGWYRSDDGYDIMEDTSSVDNRPGPSDEKRYDWHYDQCATNQNC